MLSMISHKKKLFYGIKKSNLFHKIRKLSFIDDYLKINKDKIVKVEAYIDKGYYDSISYFLIKNDIYGLNLGDLIFITPGLLIDRGLEHMEVGRVMDIPILPSFDITGIILVIYFEDIDFDDLIVFMLGGKILDITIVINKACIGVVSNTRNKSYSRAKKEFNEILKEVKDG